jgi:hypothetical protein
MRSRLAAALSLAIALGAASAYGQQPRAEMSLDPRGEIGLEEAVQVTVKIDSPGQTRLSPPLFQLENLQIVSGPSQSTSIQVINGAMSQSLSFTWLMQPQKLGRARILSATVDVGGQTLELTPAEIQVVANPPARPQRRSNDPFDRLFRNDPFFQRDPAEDFFQQRRRRQQQPARAPQIFLEGVVDQSKPWLGQQLLYTLYLYTEVDVRSVSPTKLPDFKGFWTEVVPLPDNNAPEILERDGRRMGRLPLLQRALFPRQSGRLEIGPVEAAMTVLTGDSIFGISPMQSQVTRQSNPVLVEARPLPAGAPADFNGVVGQVEFAAKLEPRSLEVGQAATLELKLSGRGHLQGVAAPVIPAIAGLQVFPPQQSGGDTVKKTTVVGNRVWSYVLVPDRAGKIALPPLQIPYFDPAAGRFQTASTAPLELEVKGSTQAVREGGGNVALHPIRPNALPAEAITAGGRSSWPLLLLLLPWLLVLPAWALRRGRVPAAAPAARPAPGGASFAGPAAPANVPASAPAAAEAPSRRDLMVQLERLREEKKPRQAALYFEETWRRFLEQSFGLPPGTPVANWRDHLLRRGIAADAADQMARLADDLHYLRYAPELSSTDELRADLLDRSQRLLKALS